MENLIDALNEVFEDLRLEYMGSSDHIESSILQSQMRLIESLTEKLKGKVRNGE